MGESDNFYFRFDFFTENKKIKKINDIIGSTCEEPTPRGGVQRGVAPHYGLLYGLLN